MSRSGSGIDKRTAERNTAGVLLEEYDATSALVPTDAGFTLMPGGEDLTAAEVGLLAVENGRELRLRNALRTIRNLHDIILIDCPPSLNMLTVNALRRRPIVCWCLCSASTTPWRGCRRW